MGSSPIIKNNARAGFTLVELLIFAAIFSFVMIAFLGILVFVTQLETQQSAKATVNQESQFLLSTVQRYVENSSVVDIPLDTPTSSLKLRMPTAASDPAYLYLSSSTVYLQETATGTPQPLTSANVNVTALTFSRHANPPGHDAVSVAFTITYNGSALTQTISRSLEVAVARVSAATFDSSLIPSSTATFDLGVTNQVWRSVNNTLYFNGSNVGVGVAAPSQIFQVAGGDIYVSTAGNGVILKSPGGSCYKVTVTNAGTLLLTGVSCT